jgi:hypothetical protein
MGNPCMEKDMYLYAPTTITVGNGKIGRFGMLRGSMVLSQKKIDLLIFGVSKRKKWSVNNAINKMDGLAKSIC